MLGKAAREYHVVLIDDDLDEAEFLLEAIAEAGLPIRLQYYKDYYQFAQCISSSSLPDLLVMDINLPLINGIDALHTLKSNQSYSTIPAVTFTSTSSEKFQVQSKMAGAMQLIIKPTTTNGYKTVVQQFYNLCCNKAALAKPQYDPLNKVA